MTATAPSELAIRPATGADASGVARIHVASWRRAYRGLLPQSFLDRLSVEARTAFWERAIATPLPGAVTLVAVVDDRVVGFCSCGPAREAASPGTTGEIAAIYVDPGRYRQGIGHALMDAAVAHLSGKGFTNAILWVLNDNAIGRGFYDRYGWVPDGATKVDSIGGVEVTEVRYRLDLGSGDRDESH